MNEYDAEKAFRQQVEQLCHDLWPTCTPKIEFLRGGSFNEIAAITMPSRGDQSQRNLILRVPRFSDGSRLEQQIATLAVVRGRTSIPVPTIAGTCFTYDNALGKPYVLQHRIPGLDLSTVWSDLSHPQRCIIAAEVGRMTKTLLSVESLCAGIIEPSPDGPIVLPFQLIDTYGDDLPEANKIKTGSSSFSQQTTLTLLESHFTTWKTAALTKYDGYYAHQALLYDSLIRVVREMDSLNLFAPDHNYLCHRDLYPRNIMVTVLSRDAIKITGILDWDDAIFAPKCVACRPPRWVWEYNDNAQFENCLLRQPYKQGGEDDTFLTPRQQELKWIFDQNAGPEYSRLAYAEFSTLIRGLFELATGGLPFDLHKQVAERIVMQWDLLKPTLAHSPEI